MVSLIQVQGAEKMSTNATTGDVKTLKTKVDFERGVLIYRGKVKAYQGKISYHAIDMAKQKETLAMLKKKADVKQKFYVHKSRKPPYYYTNRVPKDKKDYKLIVQKDPNKVRTYENAVKRIKIADAKVDEYKEQLAKYEKWLAYCEKKLEELNPDKKQ